MCGARQSCDLNNCAGRFTGNNPYGHCTNWWQPCECLATSNTCGARQSCDLNGCNGSFDSNSQAPSCRGNFLGCACQPTDVRSHLRSTLVIHCWANAGHLGTYYIADACIRAGNVRQSATVLTQRVRGDPRQRRRLEMQAELCRLQVFCQQILGQRRRPARCNGHPKLFHVW